jgi:hypothetical protein
VKPVSGSASDTDVAEKEEQLSFKDLEREREVERRERVKRERGGERDGERASEREWERDRPME